MSLSEQLAKQALEKRHSDLLKQIKDEATRGGNHILTSKLDDYSREYLVKEGFELRRVQYEDFEFGDVITYTKISWNNNQ